MYIPYAFILIEPLGGFSLKGYHGTTLKNANSILETQKIYKEDFSVTPDVVIKKAQNLPKDLGQGLYLFLSDEAVDYDGCVAAKKYAQIFRHENHKVKVIEFYFDESELLFLDMNREENKKRFIRLREEIYGRIEHQLGSFKCSGSLNRANLDGIFIEYLIQNKYEGKVDGVILDTYTPFYSDRRTLSNIPNGRELCLRNVSTIKWEQTKIVE